MRKPYTYFTLEFYDQENGIRGGGGLGVLAADTRRVAEEMEIPFVAVTPFYPRESYQVMNDGVISDERREVSWRDFGFEFVDTVNIRCNGELCHLEVVQKAFEHSRIVCVTEPNFGELYEGLSGSDHRLYQEVALGFGGFQALKILFMEPAVLQLNEVVTFFAALAYLDDLVSKGVDFYEAMVYIRKHTLYTNHTLVQAAEAEFTEDQFQRYVYPNLKSRSVLHWLSEQFVDGKLKLSAVTLEVSGRRNGVSKLHARVADYHDVNGNKVEFRAVTNGIDMKKWVLPEILTFYANCGIMDNIGGLAPDFRTNLDALEAKDIRKLKKQGREVLNEILKTRPDQNGKILKFKADDFIFDFKRRFVDYKRPDLPFRDLTRLRSILEPRRGHYILSGRVHTGDANMAGKLADILARVSEDDYLRTHVHYIADYDEKLAYGLSVGSNVAINVPIVGLEACGTSWMKDVANLNLLISTHDGGVADVSVNNYLNVAGESEKDELESLYARMEEAAEAWDSDFDLEFLVQKQLSAYLPVISGHRMMKNYLDFLLKA